MQANASGDTSAGCPRRLGHDQLQGPFIVAVRRAGPGLGGILRNRDTAQIVRGQRCAV